MKPLLRAAAFAVVIAAASVLAQAPGIQRTVVYKADVSVPGREAVIARVELAPGASAGRPTPPRGGNTYVLEGEGGNIIKRQPTPQGKGRGGFVIPPGGGPHPPT